MFESLLINAKNGKDLYPATLINYKIYGVCLNLNICYGFQ